MILIVFSAVRKMHFTRQGERLHCKSGWYQFRRVREGDWDLKQPRQFLVWEEIFASCNIISVVLQQQEFLVYNIPYSQIGGRSFSFQKRVYKAYRRSKAQVCCCSFSSSEWFARIAQRKSRKFLISRPKVRIFLRAPNQYPNKGGI